MKTNLNEILNQIKNEIVYRDILGFELFVGDIVSFYDNRRDKQIIGYIYFIDDSKIYVCNANDRKHTFTKQFTHPEKMCIKINDIYKFNNLVLPKKGEKKCKQTKKYFVFIKPKNEEKWKFSVIKPEYEINKSIIEKIYEVFGSSTIDNLNDTFYLLLSTDYYQYVMTCENKKLFEIIKNLPQNTHGFSASILLPRNINYPKCFEYSTLSEMKSLHFNEVQTIEHIDENTMITNLHTYKNKVASKNICDIYASLKYYDKN